MSEELEGQANPNPQPHQPFQQPFNQADPFSPQGGGFGGMQQALPNATAVLVLGILSIVTCCCFYGILGVALAIIALVLSKKDRERYAGNMAFYSLSSYKNLNAGRTCAIIGLILSVLVAIACIVIVAMFGFGILNDKEALQEIIRDMQNR